MIGREHLMVVLVGLGSAVQSLAMMNGEIYAGGSFEETGDGVAVVVRPLAGSTVKQFAKLFLFAI
jgi:hypothetical protein